MATRARQSDATTFAYGAFGADEDYAPGVSCRDFRHEVAVAAMPCFAHTSSSLSRSVLAGRC